MSDVLVLLREAFDDEHNSARKNIALRKGADEIVRLRASNAELLVLLKQIVADCEHLKDSNDSEGETIFDKARAAIERQAICDIFP